MIVHPTNDIFKQMVCSKLLINLPVRLDDITNAHTILGSQRAGIQGKTVRKNPTRVETDYILTPRDLNDIHKFVTLTADMILWTA